MLRRIKLAVVLVLAAACNAQTVRFGVLGLFHPRELRVTERITDKVYDVTLVRTGVLIRSGQKQWKADHFALRGDFTLSVPGKLTRHYTGELTVSRMKDELLAVVAVDLESAVARIVASETEPGTPDQALRAQAIVTRSYLLGAGERHVEFDFCDTTHCQFFGDAPTRPAVLTAVRETHGMVLSYAGRPLGAMFTKSCGGATKTAAAIGMHPPEGAYPYYVVQTNYCLRNPDAWRRSLPRAAVSTAPQWRIESFRLAIGRLLGWSAIPSNEYTVHEHGKSIELWGAGHGHGLGLCQRGAAAMAQEGTDFRTILAHYYPNTTIESLPR